MVSPDEHVATILTRCLSVVSINSKWQTWITLLFEVILLC